MPPRHALHRSLATAALALGIAAPAAAQNLTIGIGGSPTSLDPHFYNASPNISLTMHVFDRLVDQDARARLLAMTHDPEAFALLYAASAAVPGAGAVPASLRWYLVQSLLAIWEDGRDDVPDRLAAHVEKALREAREVTSWAHPDAPAEARAALGLAGGLAPA